MFVTIAWAARGLSLAGSVRTSLWLAPLGWLGRLKTETAEYEPVSRTSIDIIYTCQGNSGQRRERGAKDPGVPSKCTGCCADNPRDIAQIVASSVPCGRIFF